MKLEKRGIDVTKFQFFITLVMVLFFSVTGFTYAYFAFSAFNNTTITGEVASVSLSLDVVKIFPSSSSKNTGVMVPQLSISGSSSSPLASALKSGCVDSNSNIICQVYKATVKNDGGSATIVVDGSLLFYGDSDLKNDISSSMPNLKWKLIDSADATTPTNSVLGLNEDIKASASVSSSKIVSNLTLETNEEKDYYFIVWINETSSDQKTDEGKSFYGVVEFTSSNGTGVTSTFSA